MARNDIFISAGPETVFDVLSDPRAYPDWVPGTRAVRTADARWPEEGTAFEYVAATPGVGITDRTRVIAALPPVMLELRIRVGRVFSVRAAIELVPEGNGTRLILVEEPASRLLSVLIGPAGHLIIRVRNREALRRLKAIAETRRPRRRGDGAAAPRPAVHGQPRRADHPRRAGDHQSRR